MLEEPLGLPKGSVRAIIAVGVTVAVVAASFTNQSASEILSPIATLILGYYFGSRSEFNKG